MTTSGLGFHSPKTSAEVLEIGEDNPNVYTSVEFADKYFKSVGSTDWLSSVENINLSVIDNAILAAQLNLIFPVSNPFDPNNSTDVEFNKRLNDFRPLVTPATDPPTRSGPFVATSFSIEAVKRAIFIALGTLGTPPNPKSDSYEAELSGYIVEANRIIDALETDSPTTGELNVKIAILKCLNYQTITHPTDDTKKLINPFTETYFAPVLDNILGNILLMSDEVKQAAIFKAGEYLNKKFSAYFIGQKQNSNQFLEWPRKRAYSIEKGYNFSGIIPKQMVLATCELAKRVITIVAGERTVSEALAPDPDFPRLAARSTSVSGVSESESYIVNRPYGGRLTANNIVSYDSLPEYPEAEMYLFELLDTLAMRGVGKTIIGVGLTGPRFATGGFDGRARWVSGERFNNSLTDN